jgi:hypothetical protein
MKPMPLLLVETRIKFIPPLNSLKKSGNATTAEFFLKSQKEDGTEQQYLFLFEEKKCLTGLLVRRCFITCTVKSHCLSKNILIT